MQLDCLETSGRELASTEQLQETAVVEDRDLIDNNVATVVSGERALPPPASHSKTPAHDRHLVISRYKEKRKTRRWCSPPLSRPPWHFQFYNRSTYFNDHAV